MDEDPTRARNRWFTCREVAKVLGVPVWTVRKWCAAGNARAIRPDSAYRITGEEFQRLARESGRREFISGWMRGRSAE